jgi:phospholipid N-methyltransferase
MPTATAISRTFTTEESTAIASIVVDGTEAMIAFQSNPEKIYTYECNESFVNQLEQILSQDTIQGLGYLVGISRKNQDLKEVQL